MNFYHGLNRVVEYIESHLDDEIDFARLSTLAGINLGLLQRTFPLITGYTIADYIRKRRLTMAGRDLVQSDLRITDLASKYNYESIAAFSRAFRKFHGHNPKEIKNGIGQLKHCSKIVLSVPATTKELNYEIVHFGPLELYGLFIDTDNAHIRKDAPELYMKAEKDWAELGHPEYGMVEYGQTRDCPDGYRYWVLWSKPHEGFVTYRVNSNRWIKIQIPSQEASEIQAMSDQFYENFLPTCCYKLSMDPELEHYHDGITDFMIPIR